MLGNDIVQVLDAHLASEPQFRAVVAEVFAVAPDEVNIEQSLMTDSAMLISDHEDALARPGWTILASDIAGMPWGVSDPSTSHGTWATHDECGTVQKITMARPECNSCPPEPESRTHRAKQGQPQLLYLVRYLDLVKFGHGDGNRVRAHLRSGCHAVQVLQAPHERVVAAELRLRRTLRERTINPDEWNLPSSFGVGSEVLEGTTRVNLNDVLSGPDVVDVTARWTT